MMAFLGLDFLTRPWLGLLMLAPLVLFLARGWIKPRPAAVVFSDLRMMENMQTWRTRTLFIPKVLQLLAWTAFVVAMMGPRLGHEETSVTTEGIAIGMVMDVSKSMEEADMPTSEGVITRYETVERVFREFINGNEKLGLEGRKNDMVSLIIFGKYADELSPLTLDHHFVLDLMHDNIVSIRSDIKETDEYAQKFGGQKTNELLQRQNPIWLATSIYDGVALGADLLNKSDEALSDAQKKGEGNYRFKSKILILLSDGQDTGSQISAEDAIRVAKEFGIKIYTISIHGQPLANDIFGSFIRINTPQQPDDGALKTIAAETGGKFYQATDPEGLIKVYKDIENLEKSKISREVTMEYSPCHKPWIMAGMALLLLHILLVNTLYRELP